MKTSLIGFGDADAFYSSAEVVRRPWLQDMPLGILGNQGACVIARSYSMKAFGVKVGEPIWEARKKCPDGIYVKRDFAWYESLSRRMLEELKSFSPTVEYYSIDEFFWRGEPSRNMTWQQTAEAVRGHIRQRVGLPLTVAFARSRTLAKLFADTSKPNGAVAVTDQDHERQLLAKLPVTEIAGIAARLAKLLPYGIRTCLDLAQASGHLVRKLLTVTGHDIWCELNGIPAVPILPNRTPHKMLSRGGSLAGHVHDPLTLYGWLTRNVERLIEELHYHEVRPRVLTIYVAYFEDAPGFGHVTLNVPSDDFAVLMEAAKRGLRQAWRRGLAATHMHLLASQLVKPGAWQRSLFDTIEDERSVELAELKKSVNDRIGRFALRSGATLFANAFYHDPANLKEICDIREKFCF